MSDPELMQTRQDCTAPVSENRWRLTLIGLGSSWQAEFSAYTDTMYLF